MEIMTNQPQPTTLHLSSRGKLKPEATVPPAVLDTVPWSVSTSQLGLSLEEPLLLVFEEASLPVRCQFLHMSLCLCECGAHWPAPQG